MNKDLIIQIFLMALIPFFFTTATEVKAQQLQQSGSFLLTRSRDTVPQGEVWKITGSFGAPSAVAEDPSDTAALAKKYRDMYNLRLENIHPQNLKGGMILKDVLPVWLAEGSVFSIDPADLMELFAERYKILR